MKGREGPVEYRQEPVQSALPGAAPGQRGGRELPGAAAPWRAACASALHHPQPSSFSKGGALALNSPKQPTTPSPPHPQRIPHQRPQGIPAQRTGGSAPPPLACPAHERQGCKVGQACQPVSALCIKPARAASPSMPRRLTGAAGRPLCAPHARPTCQSGASLLKSTSSAVQNVTWGSDGQVAGAGERRVTPVAVAAAAGGSPRIASQRPPPQHSTCAGGCLPPPPPSCTRSKRGRPLWETCSICVDLGINKNQAGIGKACLAHVPVRWQAPARAWGAQVSYAARQHSC